MNADQARGAIAALFEEWLARLGDEDQSFYERVIADDWVYTDINGVVRGKREYLPYVGSLSGTLTSRLIELEVRLHGDMAIVTGQYRIEGSLTDGTDVSSSTRFTAVWQSTEGGWRALAHHATRIANP